jgi:hypothetical protein
MTGTREAWLAARPELLEAMQEQKPMRHRYTCVPNCAFLRGDTL